MRVYIGFLYYLCGKYFAMKVLDIVDRTINRFPTGFIFTTADFDVDVKQRETVRRYLSKIAAEGRIMRQSRGKYYKPENSPFGQVPVSTYQALKDLLEDGTRRIGYITGYSVFNEFNLTTQVPNTYQIALNEVKKPIKRGRYQVKFMLQKNTITKDNIPLLKLLDCIKLIKKIPDTTIDQSVSRIMAMIIELSSKALKSVIRLSMKYPPSTRALLGAMVEVLFSGEDAKPLMDSLNGMSKYKLNISDNLLPNKDNWNII